MAVQVPPGTRVLQGQTNLKIDLGCCRFKRQGYIGFDLYEYTDVDPEHAPDFLCDLDEGIPLDDNSVAAVYTSHLLEHINTWASFFHEIWRVCQPGAIIEIRVPYLQHFWAFALGHTRFISERWFDDVLLKRLFIITSVEKIYDEAVLKTARKCFPTLSAEDMGKLFWNVIQELKATCTPIK